MRAGNLASLTDPENNTHQFSYDALSRRTLETRPLGETIQFDYDDRGRLDHTGSMRGISALNTTMRTGAQSVMNATTRMPPAPTCCAPEPMSYNLDGQPTAASDDAVQVGDLYTTTYDSAGRPDINTVKYIPGGDIITKLWLRPLRQP